MKNVKLNTINRIMLIRFMNEEGKKQSFALSEINTLLGIFNKINLLEEETKDLIEENGFIRSNSNSEKDISLEDAEWNILNRMFKSKNESKTFSLENAQQIVELLDKLGIKFE